MRQYRYIQRDTAIYTTGYDEIDTAGYDGMHFPNPWYRFAPLINFVVLSDIKEKICCRKSNLTLTLTLTPPYGCLIHSLRVLDTFPMRG